MYVEVTFKLTDSNMEFSCFKQLRIIHLFTSYKRNIDLWAYADLLSTKPNQKL